MTFHVCWRGPIYFAFQVRIMIILTLELHYHDKLLNCVPVFVEPINTIYPFLHYLYRLSIKCHREAGANLKGLWMKEPGYVLARLEVYHRVSKLPVGNFYKVIQWTLLPWAWLTVYVEFHMLSPCPWIFFWVLQFLPTSQNMHVDGWDTLNYHKVWMSVWMSIHGTCCDGLVSHPGCILSHPQDLDSPPPNKKWGIVVVLALYSSTLDLIK